MHMRQGLCCHCLSHYICIAPAHVPCGGSNTAPAHGQANIVVDSDRAVGRRRSGTGAK